MRRDGRHAPFNLGQVHAPLAKLWEIAAPFGLIPIIAKPDASKDRAWRFERRALAQTT
jgi:hypothetical protein